MVLGMPRDSSCATNAALSEEFASRLRTGMCAACPDDGLMPISRSVAKKLTTDDQGAKDSTPATSSRMPTSSTTSDTTLCLGRRKDARRENERGMTGEAERQGELYGLPGRDEHEGSEEDPEPQPKCEDGAAERHDQVEEMADLKPALLPTEFGAAGRVPVDVGLQAPAGSVSKVQRHAASGESQANHAGVGLGSPDG